MKEKKKEILNKPDGGDGDSVFDVTPEPENKNVSVSSGPYLEEVPVAGMSVGEVRKRFKDRFDIDDESTAIINGNDATEDIVLKAGEALMFVRHAGEKGVEITIDGEIVTHNSPEGRKKQMTVTRLIERAGPGNSTGPCILPNGVKAVFSRGQFTIWVWEKAPAVQKLSWIRNDSPAAYGSGTTYRNVRIGLPYLIIFAVFQRDGNGMPQITKGDECFFRTEPLKTLDDELSYPALLNCSKYGDGKNKQNPLSWICTQFLRPTKQMRSKDVGERYCGCLEAVRYCLLETSFNLSSEHHEGNSWYGASKHIDKRIETIEAWEEATSKDPLFVLDVPWIPTKHSVAQVADRIFNRLGAADTTVKTAADLARIIDNG